MESFRVGPRAQDAGTGWTGLVAAVAVTAITALPLFLTGAMAVQLQQSLGFGAPRLGVAVAAFYLAAAAGSLPSGFVAERWEATRMMRAAAVSSGVILMGIALAVRAWVTLVSGLAAAGAASSMVQPATNAFLSRRVTPGRQGVAFGIKQSAIPLAAMLGGLAVPGLALTAGWRVAFGCAACLCGVSVLTLPGSRKELQRRDRGRVSRRPRPRVLPLLVLTTWFALGVAAASSLGAFLVVSGVAAGLPKAEAGLIAALAGAAAIASRLLAGLRADQRGYGHFRAAAVMLGAGASGYVVLALGALNHASFLFIPAAVLASAMGWGWNGLFNFALVRSYPLTPAWVTGVSQTGSRLGAVVGPLAFGMLVADVSYGAGWLCCAAMALCASLAIAAGQRLAAGCAQPGTNGQNGDARAGLSVHRP